MSIYIYITGKARYVYEIFSHLNDNWITPDDKPPSRWRIENNCYRYIHLDFGNNIKPHSADNDISDTSIILVYGLLPLH